jgi:hypothetical protein
MSIVNLNDPAYDVLNTYAVLAASGITSANTTTVKNGKYGAPSDVTITGTYVGATNATAAQTQLTDLVNDVDTVRATWPTLAAQGTTTFFGNTNYFSRPPSRC